MAVSIGVQIASDLETLRNDVLKAGVLNAKSLQESAESHVANLGSLLAPSAELDEASFQVVASVIAFARLLYGQAWITESENARRRALASIDRLALLAGRAKSSESALIEHPDERAFPGVAEGDRPGL